MNCPCCIMVNGTHDPRCPNGYTFSPVKNGESGVVTTAANVRNVTPGAREWWDADNNPFHFPATKRDIIKILDAYRSQVLNEAIEKVEMMPFAKPQGELDAGWNAAIAGTLAVLRDMKG